MSESGDLLYGLFILAFQLSNIRGRITESRGSLFFLALTLMPKSLHDTFISYLNTQLALLKIPVKQTSDKNFIIKTGRNAKREISVVE